jgi:hypothetical protein
LPNCYEGINKIKILCRKENIYGSRDKITDANERKAANVIAAHAFPREGKPP